MKSTSFWFGILGVVLGLAGCSTDEQSITPAVKSRRGESCSATNDCDKGLTCVGQVCSQNDFPVSKTAKYCFIVDCSSDNDCCTSARWVPQATVDQCATYEADCNADAANCAYYKAYCVCPSACSEDQLCVPKTAGCTVDTDCTVAGLLHCSGGQCVACTAAEHCTVQGQSCIKNVCRAPCVRDEQCPLFSACESGECVETGCKSDRECILAMADPASTCSEDKMCVTPCTSNAQCNQGGKVGFICQEGVCTFIGCETAEDCRAFRHVQQSPSTAECRELKTDEEVPSDQQ